MAVGHLCFSLLFQRSTSLQLGILFCAINNTRKHKLMCQNSNLKILFVEVFGDYAPYTVVSQSAEPK